VCIIGHEYDEAKCLKAVKAACMIGSIPEVACRSAFGGSKDSVTEFIFGLIEGGNKCRSTSKC
jgi:hypothetical protein